MKSIVLGLVILTSYFAVYQAAPQAPAPPTTVAPTPPTPPTPPAIAASTTTAAANTTCKGKGRKGRSINATTITGDAIRVGQAIQSAVEENARKIASQIDSQIKQAFGPISSFSSTNNDAVAVGPVLLSRPDGPPPNGTPPSGQPPSGTPPSGTPPSGTPPSATTASSSGK